jgi:hypothetical protein
MVVMMVVMVVMISRVPTDGVTASSTALSYQMRRQITHHLLHHINLSFLFSFCFLCFHLPIFSGGRGKERGGEGVTKNGTEEERKNVIVVNMRDGEGGGGVDGLFGCY